MSFYRAAHMGWKPKTINIYARQLYACIGLTYSLHGFVQVSGPCLQLPFPHGFVKTHGYAAVSPFDHRALDNAGVLLHQLAGAGCIYHCLLHSGIELAPSGALAVH